MYSRDPSQQTLQYNSHSSKKPQSMLSTEVFNALKESQNYRNIDSVSKYGPNSVQSSSNQDLLEQNTMNLNTPHVMDDQLDPVQEQFTEERLDSKQATMSNLNGSFLQTTGHKQQRSTDRKQRKMGTTSLIRKNKGSQLKLQDNSARKSDKMDETLVKAQMERTGLVIEDKVQRNLKDMKRM